MSDDIAGFDRRQPTERGADRFVRDARGATGTQPHGRGHAMDVEYPPDAHRRYDRDARLERFTVVSDDPRSHMLQNRPGWPTSHEQAAVHGRYRRSDVRDLQGSNGRNLDNRDDPGAAHRRAERAHFALADQVATWVRRLERQVGKAVADPGQGVDDGLARRIEQLHRRSGAAVRNVGFEASRLASKVHGARAEHRHLYHDEYAALDAKVHAARSAKADQAKHHDRVRRGDQAARQRHDEPRLRSREHLR